MQQRFGIRKFTVDVVSALIGLGLASAGLTHPVLAEEMGKRPRVITKEQEKDKDFYENLDKLLAYKK